MGILRGAPAYLARLATGGGRVRGRCWCGTATVTAAAAFRCVDRAQRRRSAAIAEHAAPFLRRFSSGLAPHGTGSKGRRMVE